MTDIHESAIVTELLKFKALTQIKRNTCTDHKAK